MNYIGSKHSLSQFLFNTISEYVGIGNDNYTGIRLCDGFAGSGAVSKLFKSHGAYVIANDIQYYSYVTLKHFVCSNEDTPLNANIFEHLNVLPGVDGFIYNNYCAGSGSGRMYYKDENGRRCDAIRQEIEHLYTIGEITDGEYYWCLASLLEAIDKVANTASVYAAFLKHIKKSAQKDLVVHPLPVINGPVGEVLQGDIVQQMPSINCDILYLDPPYNTRQYPAYYHLLETIARYDEPVIPDTVTGVRPYAEQKSDWCVKSKAPEALAKLIEAADCEYIFLSYNNEGLMSLDTVREIMSNYGEYKLATTNYQRFRADKPDARQHKADKTVEYLHCLYKR